MADKEGLRQIAEAYCKSTSPAFCKTPTVPAGYDLIGFYNLSESTADTVRMTSCETFTAESRLFTCQGNEAGVGGGVVSGVNLGYCKPLGKWSKTVRAKNQWICRHDTLMGMNCAGPEGIHETEGIAYYVKSTTCVKVEPSGQITEQQSDDSDEKDADANGSESPSDAAPTESVQDADIRRAGESLKEQAVAVKDAVVGVAEDVKQSVQNIIDDPSIVGKNLDRIGNSISEYGDAVSQDWTKPFQDAYSAGENLVSGAWGEIKEVASETATETANNQPLTALAKAGPKLIGALSGAKGVISAARGLKSVGGKILGKKKPKVPASGGSSAPGKDGVRVSPKQVAAAGVIRKIRQLSRKDAKSWLKEKFKRRPGESLTDYDERIENHLRSINWDKPVYLVEVPEGTMFGKDEYPFRIDGDATLSGNQSAGTFLTDPGADPNFSAIEVPGRSSGLATANSTTEAIQSTTADWPTDQLHYSGVGGAGGNTQYIMPPGTSSFEGFGPH